MEIDMLKSSSSSGHDLHHHHPHHQMDMMIMMHQTPHEFYPNTTNPPPPFSDIDFTWGASSSSSSANPNQPIYPNTPTFPNPYPIQSNIPIKHAAVGGDASNPSTSYTQKRHSMAAMREMIFRIAAMQPIQIDPEAVKPPKRRNVKISKDPQSVAARHRRERISERIRILQRLVPGGTKMDTASMLDEAIHYVKFLKKQVQNLERAGGSGGGGDRAVAGVGFMGPHQMLR